MSGGKGGSQTTQVEIPKFIEDAARQNLARAQATARMGYLPYYGPEVAAFSPLQTQAMQSAGTAGQAFGLAGPRFDATASIPTPDVLYRGMQGYGSGELFEQQLKDLQTKSPAQFTQYTSLPTMVPNFDGYSMPVPGQDAGYLPGGDEAVLGSDSPFFTVPSIDFMGDPRYVRDEGTPDTQPFANALPGEDPILDAGLYGNDPADMAGMLARMEEMQRSIDENRGFIEIFRSGISKIYIGANQCQKQPK